jgi:hypothetical protein
LGVLNSFNWKQLAFITNQQNLFLKTLSDLDQLRQDLRDGTSEICCFDNHDIVTDNAVFEDNGDPVVAARQIFV